MVLGDVWADQRIDILDTVLVIAAFGRCSSDASFQPFIDVDGDGCVKQPDLDIVGDNVGLVGPTSW